MTTTTTTERGLCIDCNYSLAGIPSTRCPECGRPFDPADTRTMNTRGPIGPVARFALRPTDLAWPWGGVVIACVAIVGMWTVPDIALSLLILCASLGLFLAACLPKLALRRWTIVRYRLPAQFYAVDNRAARKLHISLWFALALLFTRLPILVMFFLSLPSLSRVANHEYAEVPFDAPRPRNCWIGIIPVKDVTVGAYGVTVSTMLGGPKLYYLPNESRDRHGLQGRLFGDWYIYRE